MGSASDNKNMVSVVIATLNRAGTLQDCIASVLRQSYQRRELIVVDGGSTDGTLEVIRRNAAGIAHSVSEPDRGLYHAWNKGVRAARGEWIAFLGADDRLADAGALQALVDGAAGARIVYGRLRLVTPRGVKAEVVGVPWREARGGFLQGFMVPHPGTLHHRTLFEEHGGFDESYRIAGDYEFMLRELKTRDAAFVDRVVVDFQLGGMSSRPPALWAALAEVARARRKHGLSPSLRLGATRAASAVGAAIYRVVGERAFNLVADCYRWLRGKPPLWTR